MPGNSAASHNIALHSWQGAISQIERGERDPKRSTLILLAHALGMEPGILVNEAAKVMRIQQDPIEAVAGTVWAKSV